MTDQPRLTADGFHREFADLAELMVRERERAWPDMIKAGKLTQRQADHRLFVMRAIAEIWRCAADRLNPNKRFMALTRAEALDELAAALEAAEHRVRQKPTDKTRTLQRDQLAAMRWWHAHYPAGKISYALNMLLMLPHDALQLQLGAGASNERNAA